MTRPLRLLLLTALALAAWPARAEDVAREGGVATAARPVVQASLATAAPQPSLAERARDASAKLRAVEATTFRVQAELRGARRGKDAVRVGCLDALLTRLHVAARDGRARQEAIDGARKAGDAEAEEREVVRLAYLADRAERVYRAAGLCRTSSVVVVQGPTGTQVRASTPALPDAVDYPPPLAAPDRRRPRP
jgi:hypothetical protein